jgi:phospholipid/cholesterol/gamma-HCH transport system ATP-binding protein
MQTSNSIVSLKDVDFSYAPGERTILSGLNMEFPRGKVIAVMGGSGCGKTTVLRLIGGQVNAQKGQVLFEGEDVGLMSTSQLMSVRRRMGMLFQFGALFTDMSVF